jgi:hypothetical protein
MGRAFEFLIFLLFLCLYHLSFSSLDLSAFSFSKKKKKKKKKPRHGFLIYHPIEGSVDCSCDGEIVT